MAVKNTNNIAGIYKLTNKRTGEIYIGQSTNIKSRCKRHFDDLEKGIQIILIYKMIFIKEMNFL